MLVDANDADCGIFARVFDACVIGTGPAGMTIARRLAAQGFSVALLEGGGLDLETESQARYEGEVVGLEYYELQGARLRMFGGSSMHWGGRCRALDAIPRAYEPLGGWPIGKADLDPYAPETDAILDLIPAADAPDLPITQAQERFHRIQYRYSPPTRFGEKYRDEIAAARAITCAVNANLVDMRLDDGLGTMTAAVFKSFTPGDPGRPRRPADVFRARRRPPRGAGPGRHVCRAHSVSNLYIGSSSAFATSGYTNPTYTIVQLALRLGDHLAGVLDT